MQVELERKQGQHLQRILKLAEDEDYQTEITPENVALATALIHRKIYTDYDLLYVVGAINLLNAAVKRREFKKVIFYGRFKVQVSRILNYLTTVNRGRFNAEFYINPEESCAYVEVGGLQFSFHNISITDRLRAFIEGQTIKLNLGGVFACSV